MKRPLLGSALVLALLMTLTGGAVQPAEAGDWFIGAGFRVGGVHFSLAFDRLHRHSHPGYYYRTKHRVHYEGYRCGSYCFKRSGHGYHHQSCPVVLHHFRRYDFHPAWSFDAYRAPGYDYRYDRHPYDRGRDYGHRDYPRYDYRHRYDPRDYHRGHDRRYCPYR